MSGFKMGCSRNRFCAAIACVVMSIAHAGHAQPSQTNVVAVAAVHGPDLDLSITHYTRIQTPEGVLRESRYEEKMVRRPGHVWTERVVPETASTQQAIHRHDKSGPAASAGLAEHAHRHFNHVLLPRHVSSTGDQLRLEFVDFHEREVITIAPSEYENVNFDGSWANTFFLVDPKIVAALPVSKKTAPSGARWHELTRDGIYQRVLWDEKRLIPLVVEKGDIQGSILERMEVRVQPGLADVPRWASLKGYAQKEYADFLD
jgi:hypothetical protein